MSDLLLELFSEEIPARMQSHAAKELESRVVLALDAARLVKSNIKAYVTPRRLALHVSGLPAMQPDMTVEKKGPRTSAPAQAVDGFCQSAGITKEKLEVRGEGKDATYFAVVEQKGGPTADVLKPVLEAILKDFPWPKSMRWGATALSWVRPLRSMICLFDNTIIPIEFGHLVAGNVTQGHRFLSTGTITVNAPGEYIAALEKAHVIADAATRKDIIRKQAHELAASAGGALREDEGLLEEVTGLVEWPVCLMGEFETHYLDLPPEILILEMKHHQKYFAVTVKDGKVLNRFITVSNVTANDGGKSIIHGNQRVLRARLEDGRFYWVQDKKKPLASFNVGLEKMIFHAKLGTVAEKVKRITSLSGKLAAQVGGVDMKQVEKAASLCKADLVSGVVGQFPELQGMMGRYYAIEHGEDAVLADAIRDHYKPVGADDALPGSKVAAMVALADKFDSIVGLYSAGEKPTGSKDPFALRRSALGIIRILLEFELRLPLKAVLTMTAEQYAVPKDKQAALVEEILLFFSDRLKVILKEQGVRHDLIEAVFDGGNEDDIVRLMARVKALESFLGSEDGTNMVAAYRRATNIVRKEEKKDGKAYTGAVEAAKLIEPQEKALFEKLSALQQPVLQAVEKEQFVEAMGQLAMLRPAVDAFFDAVMVNTEDAALRETRLNLLGFMRKMLDNVANFDVLSGKE